MAQTQGSGVNSYVNYGFESTYGTPITPARTFGHGVTVSFSEKNNMERVYGLGARNATANVAKKFEGTATVNFFLSHGTFFRAVLGSVADDGAGPYTHTYTEADTIPSLTLGIGSELGTNDLVKTLTSAKVNSMVLTAAVGEAVKVKLECPYKTTSVATSGISSQTAATEDIFTFAQGSLQLPSGSTIADVQNFELTINNSLELVWGLGDRTSTATVEKLREYNLNMTLVLSDPTAFYTKFIGDASAPYTPATNPAETATLVLTFTNGGASTALRSIVVTLANISLNEDSMNFDPNELVKEDVTGWARSCTSVVWTNNTATDNASP